MTFELEGLTVRYGTGNKALTAVENVSLSVPRGGTLGLVGESGSGKSSIARAIVGIAPLAGGRILLGGVDYTSNKLRRTAAFRRRVQMIFQDPYSSLNPRMTIGSALSEAQISRGRSRRERRGEAERLLNLVGVPRSALARYPFEFSGGQRQRIAIARTLAVNPEVIICDEVTSSLDVSVQATVLNLLKDLQRELNFSSLFISHDLATVRYMSDEVAVMYSGQIVETASNAALFRDPRHPYTQCLLLSVMEVGVKRKRVPIIGEFTDVRHPPTGCRFHTRCPIGPLNDLARRICIESDPQLVADRHTHHAACHFAELSGVDPSTLVGTHPAEEVSVPDDRMSPIASHVLEGVHRVPRRNPEES